MSYSIFGGMERGRGLARYLGSQMRAFHQTLVHDVAESKDELIVFPRSREGRLQGHTFKVKSKVK